MNYTFHQLLVFQTIAQLGSITKAAEELHLTQPALSIQLKNFQAQFNEPLTEVVGRKLYLTDFGKTIAEAATRILVEASSIEQHSLAYGGALTGKLKISIVSTGKYVMPYFLSGFLKAHPGVELVMHVTNKAQVVASLENNEVDFSLVSVLPEKLQVDKIELIQNKLFLVANNERVFSKAVYTKKIFEEIPLIYREQGSGTRHVMEKFILKNKLPVVQKMELNTNEAVKQAVLAGMGCSIMPLIGIRNELFTKELQIVPVKSFPIRSVWNLVWVKGKRLSPQAQAYLSYLKKEKSNIIQEKFHWYENY